MLPIRDRNPSLTFPYATYTLIAVNVAVFLVELLLDAQGQLDSFLYRWALIPKEVLAGRGLETVLTSMFLHGGFMHIFGNMLYLYIFGNNVEDVFGHLGFIAFYIFSGTCAALLHMLLTTSPYTPTLGASGAIAGVLGAYLLFFPTARIDTIVFFYFIIRWVTIPASVLLLFWFVMQLFSGVVFSITAAASGVAYFAHVGGFITGLVLALPFRSRARSRYVPEPSFPAMEDEYWY